MLKELKALASALQKINIHSPKLFSLISLAQNLDPDTEEKIDEGDKVRILSGRYGGMTGIVNTIDESSGIAQITLRMFGREVPASEFLTELELVSKNVPKKIDPGPNKENLSEQEFKNEIKILAEKNPLAFLKNFGTKLEELDDEGIQLFEKAFTNISKKLSNVHFTSETANTILPVLVPIFQKYPEYFNFKTIKPEWILDYFSINYNYPEKYPLIKLISDDMITKAFQTSSYETKIKIIADIFSMFRQENYFIKLITNHPEFTETAYNFIIENIPSYYFYFKLENFFREDFFTRNIDKKNMYGNIIPPQVEKDYVVYKLFLIDPKEFLKLGLDQNHPTLKYEEEMSSVEKEKLSEEGVYLGDPNQNTTIRAINRILSKPWAHDLNFLIDKNYVEKYPQLIDKIKYKTLSNSNLLQDFTSLNYRYEMGFPSEVYKDLFEEIAEDLIYNQRYEDFFKSTLHLAFPDLARQLAKKIYNSDRSLFSELGLEHSGYKKVMYKVGDEVKIYAEGKFRNGVIIDYVESTGNAKVKYVNDGKPGYVELNVIHDHIYPNTAD